MIPTVKITNRINTIMNLCTLIKRPTKKRQKESNGYLEYQKLLKIEHRSFIKKGNKSTRNQNIN